MEKTESPKDKNQTGKAYPDYLKLGANAADRNTILFKTFSLKGRFKIHHVKLFKSAGTRQHSLRIGVTTSELLSHKKMEDS